jgi:hypothetical protein
MESNLDPRDEEVTVRKNRKQTRAEVRESLGSSEDEEEEYVDLRPSGKKQKTVQSMTGSFFPSFNYGKVAKKAEEGTLALDVYPDPSKWVLRSKMDITKRGQPTFENLVLSEFALGYMIALRTVVEKEVYDVLYCRLMDILREATLMPWQIVLEGECRVKHAVDIGLFTLDNALQVQHHAARRQQYDPQNDQQMGAARRQKGKKPQLGYYKKPSKVQFESFAEVRRNGKAICIPWQTNTCDEEDHHGTKLHVCMLCAENRDNVYTHPQYMCDRYGGRQGGSRM